MYLYNIIMLRRKCSPIEKYDEKFDDIFLDDSYAPLQDNITKHEGCLPPFMYRFLAWLGLH